MRIKEEYQNRIISTKLPIGVTIQVNTSDYTDEQFDYYNLVGLGFLLEDEPIVYKEETIEEPTTSTKKKKDKSNGKEDTE
jgi:hypothetical protein